MNRVPAGRSVSVRVPASSANLGPGFDSIGLALGLWDAYVVTTSESAGLVIEVTGEGAGEVPTDERHLVHATMQLASGAPVPGRASQYSRSWSGTAPPVFKWEPCTIYTLSASTLLESQGCATLPSIA